jgi:type VI secretion system (T6SS) baseplate-like injector VgrG
MPDLYFGKYTGIVKDNRDADTLGRIQVSVPAIFPEDEQVQARAALPYGWFFVPENEAKVWVEFEGGDPGLPIWSGVQFVPGEWPDPAKVDPPQKRVIVTAAGHVLAFHDKGGEEKVELKVGVHKHVITLDQQGVRVEDGVGKGTVTMDANGVKVETQQGAKVELTATMTTVDGAGGTVWVKGSQIKLSAAAAQPVARLGDQGVGNLGAPVVITMLGNPQVLA